MRRAHPCNGFGWLFVSRNAYGVAMDQQIRLRDEHLAVDPHFSGEPPAFRDWSLGQIREQVGSDPTIAEQIRNRMAGLEQQLAQLDHERVQQVAAWSAREAALSGELDLLLDLAP